MMTEKHFVKELEILLGYKLSDNGARKVTTLINQYLSDACKPRIKVEKKVFTIPTPKKSFTDIKLNPEAQVIIKEAEDKLLTMLGANVELVPLSVMRRMLTDIDKVEAIVCEAMGTNPEQIRIRGRKEEEVICRQLIFYLAGLYTKLKPGAIGRAFRKDRTTVIHGQNVIKDKIKIGDDMILDALARIEREIIELIKNERQAA